MMKTQPLSHDDCKIFTARDQLYCYVPITKVASTYLRRALPGRSFDLYNWSWTDGSSLAPDPRDITFLVMLRDPVERWVSGMTEFWCRAYPEHDWTDDVFVRSLFDTVEFDVHTQPQIDFVSHVDHARTTWLWMTPNVDGHKWFSDHDVHLGEVMIQERNLGNSRPSVYFDQQRQRTTEVNQAAAASVPGSVIQASVKRVLDQYELDHKIRDYYGQDYALIQSVAFYPS